MQNFKKNIDFLDSQISKYYNDKKEINRKLINDGIVDLVEYYNSKTKIMWILKEPRDEENSTGGGWSLVDNLITERSQGSKRDSPQTFRPIIFTSYALLNNIKKFEDLDKGKIYTEYCKSLKNIAYINIQKLPAKAFSKNIEIEKAYEIDKDILLNQITHINPDLIICTAGGNIYKKLLTDLPEDFIFQKKIINCYHPSQRLIKQETYINEILNNYYS
ncbi:uracil-DNA glycosylase family protein [Chryseobacterium sp. T1]